MYHQFTIYLPSICHIFAPGLPMSGAGAGPPQMAPGGAPRQRVAATATEAPRRALDPTRAARRFFGHGGSGNLWNISRYR